MRLSRTLFVFLYFFTLASYATPILNIPSTIIQKLPPKARTSLQEQANLERKKEVSPFPHFCPPLHANTAISMKTINNNHLLAFMEEQEKVMYEYIGIDPSVYIKDVVDASNAKEFLLYLDEMEREELKKNRIRGAHRDILFDALKEDFTNSLESLEEQEHHPNDIYLRLYDIDTIKWVDVIDADYQRRVHLYQFVCGNLDCTIRYSFHQTAPQIRWSCQKSVNECPLGDDLETFRDLTHNEIFNFLRVLSKQHYPLNNTFLTEEQQILKARMVKLLKPEHPTRTTDIDLKQ